jgi:hypothetical protein
LGGGLVCALSALLLGACGGGDDDSADTTSSIESTSSSAEGRDLDEATVELGVTIYFGGFAVELDEAALTDEDFGGLLTVTGRAENVGDDNARAPRDVFLDVDGETIDVDLVESEIPEVPGSSAGAVSYAFGVDDDFDVGSTVLTFGQAGHAQATVPLDDNTDPVTLEPVEVDVAGEVVAGELTFALEAGEVRFDRPDNHTAADEGKAFLHVTYAVTFTGDFAGGYPFGTDETRLRTPGDLALAPVEHPIELLRASSTVTDLLNIWEIDSDDPGSYAFVGVHLPGQDGEATGEHEFEIPELQPA